MPQDIKVRYHAVDALPGGVPAIFAVREGRLDLILSRSASVDELVAAVNRMYPVLARSAMAYRLVA